MDNNIHLCMSTYAPVEMKRWNKKKKLINYKTTKE